MVFLRKIFDQLKNQFLISLVQPGKSITPLVNDLRVLRH